MSEDYENQDAEDDEAEVDVTNLPSAEVIDRAMKEYSLSNAKRQSAVGEIGQMVKANEERHNIHRKAFKQVASIEKMDETKRTELLVHLFHYLALRGLGPHPDLFEDERAKELARQANKDEALLAQAESVTVQ